MDRVNFLKTKYFYLFCAVLLLIIIVPHMAIVNFSDWLLSFLFIFVLVTTIYAVRHRSRQFRIALLLTALVIVTDILDAIFPHLKILTTISGGTTLIFIFFTIQVIISDLMAQEFVTKDTVFGAMAIYFLLAIGFGVIYIVLQHLTDNAFVYSTVLANNQTIPPAKLIYFSTITLTTVGYGDIYPTNSFTQTVAALEGATGILYIAVFMAKLVSEFVRKQARHND